MRVVQVISRAHLRGAEVFAVELSDALEVKGHATALLAVLPPPAESPLLRGEHPIPHAGAAARVNRDGYISARLQFGAIRRLAAFIADAAPDIVQANGSETLKYTLLAQASTGARWPLVYRNIGTASAWSGHAIKRLWMRALVRRVAHVAAVSTESMIDFARTYAVSDDRISVIPIGASVPMHVDAADARQSLRGAAGISSASNVVLHVGSFTAEKNHHGLLEAFDSVARAQPNAHLVLIGDGPLRSSVMSAARGGGLGGRVHALGARAGARELMAGADILVLCSTTEGLPAVVIEAGMRGVPAVITGVASASSVVRHGTSGIVVPGGDNAALARAIISLLDDPAERARLGAGAKAHMTAAFGMDRVAADFERLYARLARDSTTA